MGCYFSIHIFFVCFMHHHSNMSPTQTQKEQFASNWWDATLTLHSVFYKPKDFKDWTFQSNLSPFWMLWWITTPPFDTVYSVFFLIKVPWTNGHTTYTIAFVDIGISLARRPNVFHTSYNNLRLVFSTCHMQRISTMKVWKRGILSFFKQTQFCHMLDLENCGMDMQGRVLKWQMVYQNHVNKTNATWQFVFFVRICP